MRILIRTLALIPLLAVVAFGQAVLGAPVTATTVSFTVTFTGTGTGSFATSDNKITNCTTVCTAIEPIGANVTITATPTAGSTFAFSGGTGSANVCSGTSLSCNLTINVNSTLNAVFTAAGGSALPNSPLFAIDLNNSSQFPSTISFGQCRIWDTPNSTWPFIETSAGVYDFTIFDSLMALAFTNSVKNCQMAMARTPTFYSSNTNLTIQGTLTSGTFTASETVVQTGSGISATFVSRVTSTLTISNYTGTATSSGTWVGQSSGAIFTPTALPVGCNYFLNGGTKPSNGSGQCAPPNDLNADGTGTNLHWRNWVAKLATHVNNSTYLLSHAKIVTYETWNEPSVQKFWMNAQGGTGYMDQLGRMQEDLYCIVKGGGFTITATGETCAQVRATVTSVSLSGAVDPTATIAMPSYFGQGFGLTQLQQFLYCTPPPSGGNCRTGGYHATTDVINWHGKPGVYPITLETQMTTWLTAINAILQAAELAKPNYDTEAGYASGGWVSPYTDFDLQASFMARLYIYCAFNSVKNCVWYDWSPGQNGLGSAQANAAYSQVNAWLVGGTAGTMTVASDGVHSPNSLWTATFTLPNGVSAQFMWNVDSSFNCSSGTCPTQLQTVPNPMLSYLKLEDATQTKVAITSHQVPIGIIPVLVQAQ